MGKGVNEVLLNYTIYIDSTSLMQGSMEFFKISLVNVLRGKNRKLKVVDFVVSDLRKRQFSDNERVAVKALNILDYYRKRGLIDDIVSTGKDDNSLLNVIYNNREIDNNNICIITERKEIAEQIVQSLMNDSYVNFEHDVVAVSLLDGPKVWDIEPPVKKPKKRNLLQDVESFEEVDSVNEVSFDGIVAPVNTVVDREPIITKPKRDKLVVSLVVDNSSSIQGERATKLKEAIKMFNDKISESVYKDDLDVAIYGFDGFTYSAIKSFGKEMELELFEKGGVQVLSKTMDQALTDLMNQDSQYEKQNIRTHRPWLIVLTDGDCYGDISGVAKKLRKHLKNRELTYFPFSLSNYEIEDSLEPLSKLKMFLKVKEDMFDDLLLFIFNTLQTRIETPKDEAMTLNRENLSRIIAR